MPCSLKYNRERFPVQSIFELLNVIECDSLTFLFSVKILTITLISPPFCHLWFPHRSILHSGSGLVWIFCQQGQDARFQRHQRTSVERSQSSRILICMFVSPIQQHGCDLFKGVWDWAGGLPVPTHPLLWEVLRQKHAQQGRQRDRGQDHGKRASPGKDTASARHPRERRLGSFTSMWLILIRCQVSAHNTALLSRWPQMDRINSQTEFTLGDCPCLVLRNALIKVPLSLVN